MAEKPTAEQMEAAATFFMENFQNALDARPAYRMNGPNTQLVRALCRNYVIEQGKWDNTGPTGL